MKLFWLEQLSLASTWIHCFMSKGMRINIGFRSILIVLNSYLSHK